MDATELAEALDEMADTGRQAAHLVASGHLEQAELLVIKTSRAIPAIRTALVHLQNERRV